MLSDPQTNARPSIDSPPGSYAKADASAHPEAYGRVDRNGHRLPYGCNYAPLAITSTPEYQAANGRAIGFHTAAGQWASLAGDFIEARKSLKHATSYTPEQEQLVASMSEALGAGIAKALRERDENNRQYVLAIKALAEIEGPHAERRAADPDSNSSGQAVLDAAYARKCEHIAKHGCCGDEPMSDGVCFGYGKCPKSVEVDSAVKFTTSYIDWVEQLNDESALAAVAARLSVPSPLIDSEVPNV